MHNWDDLRFCLALDRHKTMTKAAESLGANVGTVSRRIERLTEDVGETLFIKKSGAWSATESGEALIRLATDMEGRLRDFSADLHKAPAPGSTLRINIALPLLQAYFDNCTEAFLRNHKDLILDLSFRQMSVAYAETDLAVTFTRPRHGLLTHRKLGTIRVRPYVAKTTVGTPCGWVSIRFDDMDRQVRSFGERLFGHQPRMRIEGLNLAASAVAQTRLVGLFPEKFGDESAELKRWPGTDDFEELEVWLSYHSSRKHDPIVRVGARFLMEAFDVVAPADEPALT